MDNFRPVTHFLTIMSYCLDHPGKFLIAPGYALRPFQVEEWQYYAETVAATLANKTIPDDLLDPPKHRRPFTLITLRQDHERDHIAGMVNTPRRHDFKNEEEMMAQMLEYAGARDVAELQGVLRHEQMHSATFGKLAIISEEYAKVSGEDISKIYRFLRNELGI
ncbi:MAG TPA: hypothetical protein VEA59_04045 [Patescibacteria group bacterium]|nr:hypothetical protein [Patescibacteria group bacterium]